MRHVLGFGSGKTTYAIGFALLTWLLASSLPDQLIELPPPTDTTLGAFLAAMGLTIRRAISGLSPSGSSLSKSSPSS